MLFIRYKTHFICKTKTRIHIWTCMLSKHNHRVFRILPSKEQVDEGDDASWMEIFKVEDLKLVYPKLSNKHLEIARISTLELNLKKTLAPNTILAEN